MDRFTQQVLLVGRIMPDALQLLGTAFFVGVEGVLVTSRHVIGSDANNLVVVLPNIQQINSYQDVSDTLCHTANVQVLDINPIADLVLLKIDAKLASVLELGSLDEIGVGDPVEIYGFPHCVDGRRVLTYHSASIGAKVLLESSSLKVKHAVVNSQTRPGQSGSMVYSRKLNKIVGLLSGTYAPRGNYIMIMDVNPAELNQTSHIVSAEYIKEML